MGTRRGRLDRIPSLPPGLEQGYHAYARGQVEELLTGYGKIDHVFFDGGPEIVPFERLRELQRERPSTYRVSATDWIG